MVGRRFQCDFLDPICSSCGSPSRVFILGLILVYNTMLSQASTPGSCKLKDISEKYKHCGIHPGGVHDLDCFRKQKNQITATCVWKPGNHTSGQTYTLVAAWQISPVRDYCKSYRDIAGLSEKPKVSATSNMIFQVFENAETANCTKAVFSASPKSLWRCDPPTDVSFSRHSERLTVHAKWSKEDMSNIDYYHLRYKALGSPEWNTSLQSHIQDNSKVENLNSSLAYTVQIQCIRNDKCSRCVWSEAHTVPPELTKQPVIVNFNDTDSAERDGSRLLFVTWKYHATELFDGYYVTVWKASGEAPCERMITTRPEIRLILSYSAYHLNISAFNNASTSPAVSRVIPRREDELSLGAGKLNMTVHSNTSFTVYWKDNLIDKYVCYCVEWSTKGRKAAYKSFHQIEDNYKRLEYLPEPLAPYKRYTITLHRRPNKAPCNMNYINNSESTYGSTHFYLTEGSPVSAPTNITFSNSTLTSAVLEWLSIPEEDVRGFLRGYILHFIEHHHNGTSTERNITVDPTSNSYELVGLKSGTGYEVQISGFTQAGAGVRSMRSPFRTNYQEQPNYTGVIAVFAVVFTVLLFGSWIIKRAKVFLWPSIPNPRNSNTMQKIEGPSELQLLESITTLKVEEWDTNSLQIIEREDATSASTLPSILPLLRASEGEGDSVETTSDWIQRGAAWDMTAETSSDVPCTDLQTSPFAFTSGYTTMEMFQQGAPQAVPAANASEAQTSEGEPDDKDSTVVKSILDYLRQFSTSPVLEKKSTIEL